MSKKNFQKICIQRLILNNEIKQPRVNIVSSLGALLIIYLSWTLLPRIAYKWCTKVWVDEWNMSSTLRYKCSDVFLENWALDYILKNEIQVLLSTPWEFYLYWENETMFHNNTKYA